jgi:AraC-like DNA-binding protein
MAPTLTSAPPSTRLEPVVLRGDRIELFRLDDPSDAHRGVRRHPRWSHVVLFARTRSVVSWGGQMLELDAGECMVAANDRALVAAPGDPGRAIAVYLPRIVAQPYITELDAARGRVQNTEHGSARVVGSVLRCLAEEMDELPGTVVRVDPHIVGLLASMCHESMADDKTELVAACKRFIDLHLSDPDLTVEVVARAACLSVRALHRLFASEDLTVTAWIRNRRLERCAHDLQDPAQAGVSITQVHQRWGLFDSSHFSYLFRRRFGTSPRAFRSQALRAETHKSRS